MYENAKEMQYANGATMAPPACLAAYRIQWESTPSRRSKRCLGCGFRVFRVLGLGCLGFWCLGFLGLKVLGVEGLGFKLIGVLGLSFFWFGV